MQLRIDLCTVTLEMKSRSNILTRTFFGEPTLEEVLAEFKDEWMYDNYIREAIEECGEFNFATWKPVKSHWSVTTQRNTRMVPTYIATYMKDRMCLATLTMTSESVPFTTDGEAKLLQALADEKAEEMEEALA